MKIIYNLFSDIMEEYIKKIDLQTISMQTLAFIGDSVYDLYIRCYLASISNEKTGKLHVKATKYVSAKSQADIVDKIVERLNEEEKSIYKRGRNTNINTSKHAEVIEYKKATGLEALFGYLYITKNIKRIEELIDIIVTLKEEK